MRLDKHARRTPVRWIALTVDVLLLPLRIIIWPFVIIEEKVLPSVDRWIRKTWLQNQQKDKHIIVRREHSSNGS